MESKYLISTHYCSARMKFSMSKKCILLLLVLAKAQKTGVLFYI